MHESSMKEHGGNEAKSNCRAEVVRHLERHHAHGVERLLQCSACFGQQLIEKDDNIYNDDADSENGKAAGRYKVTYWQHFHLLRHGQGAQTPQAWQFPSG
jgi:hypothetical protein